MSNCPYSDKEIERSQKNILNLFLAANPEKRNEYVISSGKSGEYLVLENMKTRKIMSSHPRLSEALEAADRYWENDIMGIFND